MMFNIDNNPEVPSKKKEILRSLIGKKVKNIFKCSFQSPNDFIEECGDKSLFLQFAHGPLLLEIDDVGLVGFSFDDSQASLIVWLEKGKSGETNPEYEILKDEEYFIVEAHENEYGTEQIRDILTQNITKINILKRKPQNAKYIDLPNDAGVQIFFEKKQSIVLSFNLYQTPSELSLIIPEDINEKVWQELSPVEIS